MILEPVFSSIAYLDGVTPMVASLKIRCDPYEKIKPLDYSSLVHKQCSSVIRAVEYWPTMLQCLGYYPQQPLELEKNLLRRDTCVEKYRWLSQMRKRRRIIPAGFNLPAGDTMRSVWDRMQAWSPRWFPVSLLKMDSPVFLMVPP